MPKTKAPSLKLTVRQAEFVHQYLIDLCGAKAAVRAGFSVRSASRIANELLAKAHVQEAVAQAMAKRARRIELTQDRVLQELARVAFFDPRKLLHPDGSPKPVDELDDDTAAALAGMDIAEEWEGTGKDRRFVGYTKKVKTSDKVAALGLAMRHLGMMRDRVEMTGRNGGPLQTETSVVHFYLPENGR